MTAPAFMLDFSRLTNSMLMTYSKVKDSAILCLNSVEFELTAAYLDVFDNIDRKDYIVYRHKILYRLKQVGNLVRYVDKTRHDNCKKAEVLTRFEFDTRELDDDSIVEFDAVHDNMSNEETLVKLARLKELAMQARQSQILDEI